MLPLIRTDRSVLLCHSDDPVVAGRATRDAGWFEVDAPPAGALCVEVRALSASEFFEASQLARLRSDAAARREGLDPAAVVEPAIITEEGKLERSAVTVAGRLEQGHMATLAARRGVVRVHGVDLDTPGAIVDLLLPSHAADLGMQVIGRSVLAPDPFVAGGSGR